MASRGRIRIRNDKPGRPKTHEELAVDIWYGGPHGGAGASFNDNPQRTHTTPTAMPPSIDTSKSWNVGGSTVHISSSGELHGGGGTKFGYPDSTSIGLGSGAGKTIRDPVRKTDGGHKYEYGVYTDDGRYVNVESDSPNGPQKGDIVRNPQSMNEILGYWMITSGLTALKYADQLDKITDYPGSETNYVPKDAESTKAPERNDEAKSRSAASTAEPDVNGGTINWYYDTFIDGTGNVAFGNAGNTHYMQYTPGKSNETKTVNLTRDYATTDVPISAMAYQIGVLGRVPNAGLFNKWQDPAWDPIQHIDATLTGKARPGVLEATSKYNDELTKWYRQYQRNPSIGVTRTIRDASLRYIAATAVY